MTTTNTNRIPTDEQKIERALRSLLGRVRCTSPDDASAILAKLGEVFDLFLASERDADDRCACELGAGDDRACPECC